MSDMRQFSEESLRRIQRDHTRLKALADTLAVQQQQQQREGEIIRTVTGFTSTNTMFPTYPTAAGHNTYVVKLRDYSFTPTTGVQTRSAQGNATRSIIARTWDGSSVTENTPVICDLIYAIGKGPQWWIRPAAGGAAPLRWTQMVSSSNNGSWWWWQSGAPSRDTSSPIELTTSGVFAFPRFGLGTYSNSVGTAFSLEASPTTANQDCITFTQKAYYSLCVSLTWGLPSMTSSQWNFGYRDSADHTHQYNDSGVVKTTDPASVAYPSRDTRQAVTIITEVNGVDCGRSSIPNFYSADDNPDRYATHTQCLQLDRSFALTGLSIKFRRMHQEVNNNYATAEPYVSRASVRLEQISDNF